MTLLSKVRCSVFPYPKFFLAKLNWIELKVWLNQGILFICLLVLSLYFFLPKNENQFLFGSEQCNLCNPQYFENEVKKIREFFWISFCEFVNTQKIPDIKLFANEEFEARISIFRNCTFLEFQGFHQNSNQQKPITNSEFNKKLQLLTVIKAWYLFQCHLQFWFFLYRNPFWADRIWTISCTSLASWRSLI